MPNPHPLRKREICDGLSDEQMETLGRHKLKLVNVAVLRDLHFPAKHGRARPPRDRLVGRGDDDRIASRDVFGIDPSVCT